MMDAGDAIAHELLRDVRQSVAVACECLLRRKRLSLADPVKHTGRPVRDTAVEVAIRITIEGSTGRVRRALVDVRQLESLAVVEGGVAAAMMDGDRMILRDLVEIMNIELPVVLHLGVIEEIPLHPDTRRRLACPGTKFVDDAVDGYKLNHIRIADENVIEQRVARCMIVAIDEPRDDGELPGVEGLGSLPISAFISAVLPIALKRPALTANASALGLPE